MSYPFTLMLALVPTVMQILSLERRHLALAAFMLPLMFSCGHQAVQSQGLGPAATDQLRVAEQFIDAYYSWDSARLSSVLANAPADAASVLYYQAWAQAGNYQIQQRSACQKAAQSIDCAITVTDDIGGALGYVATDTFHLKFNSQQLVGVKFTSDDPPVLQEVFAWMQNQRPEVFAGPCKDLFAGGTTPKACVRAVVQGAKDFTASSQQLSQ